MTGDVIPKPLREAGSLVVSGLLSGPNGMAMSAGMLAFEKLTGIDFEDLEQSVMASLSGASHGATAPNVAVSSPVTEPPAHMGAWTARQLAAYGVVTLNEGTLHQGDLAGSDVLNALQLGQVAPATTVA